MKVGVNDVVACNGLPCRVHELIGDNLMRVQRVSGELVHAHRSRIELLLKAHPHLRGNAQAEQSLQDAIALASGRTAGELRAERAAGRRSKLFLFLLLLALAAAAIFQLWQASMAPGGVL